MSIALIGFHEAIESYEKNKGSFVKFASLVIKRRIIDYQRREKRYRMDVSLSADASDGNGVIVADTIESGERPHDKVHEREAVKQEIEELSRELGEYGITMSDVAKNCPRQERTVGACRKALMFARENRDITEMLKRTGRLPIAALSEGAEVEKKTLERHRKYIVTLLLIYSNGYDSIRDHLRQIFDIGEGGAEA